MKYKNAEIKLEALLKKLQSLKEEEDLEKLFEVVPNTIKEIDDLGLTSITFIDKILEVIIDISMPMIARICLSYILSRLNIEDRQIVKICSILNDESYNSGIRDGLIGSLSRVVQLGNPIAIEALYSMYKDKNIELYQKIIIAKQLINVKRLSREIKESLIVIIENNSLPLLLKRDAVKVIKRDSEYDKKVIDALINMIACSDFSKDEDGYSFDSIIDNFLGMNPNNSEIDRLLLVISKNKPLYYEDEWLVDLLNKLKLYLNKIDFFIEVLNDKHEEYSSEDEAYILSYFTLSLEHTNQLLDYLEENRDDASKQIRVINILKNMPNYNPIDLDRLSKIYQFEGLTKKVYRGIKDILKERKR